MKKVLLWLMIASLAISLCACAQITKREEADAAVQDYIAGHWPASDFQPQYYVNLAGSARDFYYRAVSEASLDTWFVVCYNSETKVCWDRYESGMESTRNGVHTAERLSAEYGDQVDELLNAEGYPSSFTQVSYDSALLAQAWEEEAVVLDMSFAPDLDLGWELWIQYDRKENSPVDMDLIYTEIEKMHDVIVKAGYQFTQCRFDISWLDTSKDEIHIENIPTIVMDASGMIAD